MYRACCVRKFYEGPAHMLQRHALRCKLRCKALRRQNKDNRRARLVSMLETGLGTPALGLTGRYPTCGQRLRQNCDSFSGVRQHTIGQIVLQRLPAAPSQVTFNGFGDKR